MLAYLFYNASVVSSDADRDTIVFVGILQSLDYVGRIAGTANADDIIAGIEEVAEGGYENFLPTEIVGVGHHGGHVVAKAYKTKLALLLG